MPVLSWWHTDLRPEEVVLAAQPNFWLEEIATLELPDSPQLRLKRSSNYYCQVIGEMAILEVPWCDFVVWTEARIFVERVPFDRPFWEKEVLPKLQAFFQECLLREIVLRRLQRGQPLFH